MPEYRSKERVVRNEVLVYAEGDLIPETDTEELERQGLVERAEKSKSAGSDKSRKAASNK